MKSTLWFFFCFLLPCAVVAQEMHIKTAEGIIDRYKINQIYPMQFMGFDNANGRRLSMAVTGFPVRGVYEVIDPYGNIGPDTTNTVYSDTILYFPYANWKYADSLVVSDADHERGVYTFHFVRHKPFYPDYSGKLAGEWSCVICLDQEHYLIKSIDVESNVYYRYDNQSGPWNSNYRFSARDIPYTTDTTGNILVDIQGVLLANHGITIRCDESYEGKIHPAGAPSDMFYMESFSLLSLLPFTDDSHLVIKISP